MGAQAAAGRLEAVRLPLPLTRQNRGGRVVQIERRTAGWGGTWEVAVSTGLGSRGWAAPSRLESGGWAAARGGGGPAHGWPGGAPWFNRLGLGAGVIWSFSKFSLSFHLKMNIIMTAVSSGKDSQLKGV